MLSKRSGTGEKYYMSSLICVLRFLSRCSPCTKPHALIGRALGRWLDYVTERADLLLRSGTWSEERVPGLRGAGQEMSPFLIPPFTLCCQAAMRRVAFPCDRPATVLLLPWKRPYGLEPLQTVNLLQAVMCLAKRKQPTQCES